MLGFRVCKFVENRKINSKFVWICQICTRANVLIAYVCKLDTKVAMVAKPSVCKPVTNPLLTQNFAASLLACKLKANIKFTSDLHARKSTEYV